MVPCMRTQPEVQVSLCQDSLSRNCKLPPGFEPFLAFSAVHNHYTGLQLQCKKSLQHSPDLLCLCSCCPALLLSSLLIHFPHAVCFRSAGWGVLAWSLLSHPSDLRSCVHAAPRLHRRPGTCTQETNTAAHQDSCLHIGAHFHSVSWHFYASMHASSTHFEKMAHVCREDNGYSTSRSEKNVWPHLGGRRAVLSQIRQAPPSTRTGADHVHRMKSLSNR